MKTNKLKMAMILVPCVVMIVGGIWCLHNDGLKDQIWTSPTQTNNVTISIK